MLQLMDGYRFLIPQFLELFLGEPVHQQPFARHEQVNPPSFPGDPGVPHRARSATRRKKPAQRVIFVLSLMKRKVSLGAMRLRIGT